MRVPTADYTTQQNAIANKYQAKSGKYLAQQIGINTSNAKVARKSLQLSEKSLQLSQKSLDNQQTLALAQQEYYRSMANLNKFALGVDAIGKVVDGVYSIVQARDESKAKTAIMDILSENEERATASIVNQRNRFITDPETGEMKAVIDSELTEWQQTQYDKIKAMGLTTEVEKSTMATLQSAFNDTKSTILSGIAQDAAKGLQEYNLLLEEKALGQDLYSITFEDFINPDVDDSAKYASGFALIDGRTYYSDPEKKSAKESYRKKSNEQRAEYYVAEAAKTGGKAAAYTRAEQLRDYLNLDDETVSKLISHANTVEKQYVDSLSTQASEAMTKGLNEGTLPDELYRGIVAGLESETEGHKSEAMQAAMNAHVTWATEDISNIISGYSSYDEASLTQMLSDLSSRSAYYKGGAEAVFDEAVNQVSKQLKELVGEPAAQALISNIDAVQANNKAVKAENQGYVNAIKTGDISAYDAAYMIETSSLKFDPEYLDSLLDPNSENYNPDLYTEIISSNNDSMKLVKEALEAYKDHPLYSLFSDMVSDAENNLLNIWGKTAKELFKSNDENKKASYTKFKAFVRGSLIDLMNETASKELSEEEMFKRYENIKEIAIGSNWENMTRETLMDSANSSPTESALNTFKVFKDNPDSAYYNDYTGNIVWFDERMKNTFENAALQIGNDLSEQFGIELSGTPEVTLVNKGTGTYPVARFKATNGKEYRVDEDGNIFVVGSIVSADGKVNLLSFGKLGEESDPAQVALAETFSSVTAEQLEELVSKKPEPVKPKIPSVESIKTMIEEGYEPEEAVKKAIEETPAEAPFTIPQSKSTKSEDNNDIGMQMLANWDKTENVREGYYGPQAAAYAAFSDDSGREQKLSYQAALEARAKEIQAETGVSKEEALSRAATELAPEYFGTESRSNK